MDSQTEPSVVGPAPAATKDGEATGSSQDPAAHADVFDGSQRGTSALAADLHGTPTARRAGSGGGGLGLRPPSTHTPENASMHSGRSGVESISGESKPQSQKSSGMGFVRRLRRLSSAALHGKVNRLFTRASNPSQDSLVHAVPLSPSACPSPSSPRSQAGTVSNESYGSPAYNLRGALAGPLANTATAAAEWRASNTPDLPPLPPNHLSRRNRALTEVTPLAIRGCMDSAPADGSEGTDNISQRAMQPRAKTSNSPLIASPLSRKSFHTLSAASSRENMHSSGRSPVPQTPTATGKSPRVKSPKLIRSSSHTTGSPDSNSSRPRQSGTFGNAGADGHRPAIPHRLSYQLVSSYDSDMAYQAAQTPSPPERASTKSQAHFPGGSGTPTMQRRRTALATLGWPGSKTLQTKHDSNAAPLPPPVPPPLPKTSSATRKKKLVSSGTDSPSSLLSAFQLRPRVSSGLFRQTSADVSARSSTSITSDSMRSWASALSDTDRDNENDSADSRKGSERNSLSLATHEDTPSKDGSSMPAIPGPAETPPGQQWPPMARLQGFFYPSILEWQLAQERAAALPGHSPSSSTAYDIATTPVGAQPSAAEAANLDTALASSNSGSLGSTPSHPTPPPALVTSQAVRPRGGSQPIHLAKTATANAIRLKEKSAALSGDSITPASSRASPGSAPESFSIDMAIEKSKARLRMRATSASNQPINLGDDIAGSYEAAMAGRNSSAGPSQHSTVGRSSAVSGALPSRPPSSMSAYTMSPISSSVGDDHHIPNSHLWQPAGMFRSSPERAGDSHLANVGPHTPSSTSSPPAYHHLHHPSGHQLRLNMASVQRSASGHSVSSGISELLEPSSVSMARKDALWQVLVVSKSRADSEIDKMLRQWRETDGGVIVCAHDTDAKPSVGDEDAIILKVKRGHRRSTSDMKRADGERNEFRRRVVDLASLIRSSSVSELSNEAVTRGITEQLYGLLTEQRTRFPADANIGTLILDVLYQFSAVSQTVSQLSMPLNLFVGPRGGISGDASPAVSQFPSPQLAPELSLARGSLGTLPPLTSALSYYHDSSISSIRHSASRSLGQRDSTEQTAGLFTDPTGTPQSSIGRAQSISSTVISDAMSDLNDYRISRTASEGPMASTPLPSRTQHNTTDMYLASSTSAHMRPVDSTPHMASPRILPGTEHGSTSSLPCVLASVHSSSYNIGGSVGRAGSGLTSNFAPASVYSLPTAYQRQRLYMPSSGTLPPSRVSIDIPDTETDGDVSSRPSLDDANMRSSLHRQPSQLSISSDAGDISSSSRKRLARASLQPQKHHTPADRSRDAATMSTPKRVSRPATMFISNSGFGSLRRASDAASRQERLARLLNDDTDFSDSAPTSPVDTPVRPYLDISEDMRSISPPPIQTAGLVTIPEAKQSSDTISQDHAESMFDMQSSSVPAPSSDLLARMESQLRSRLPTDSVRRGSRPSIILEEQDELSSDPLLGTITSGPLITDPEPMEGTIMDEEPATADGHPASGRVGSPEALAAATGEELVVCRICERSVVRSELSAHSDMCILEQTRAMKLDEANHRMKRVRDSIAKRLSDLKKSRQWDKAATRESERIIRIADRALFWPEGDSQHEFIVAKAKFAKYTEKLQGIAGTGGKITSPRNSGMSVEATGDQNKAARLPRADIETLWLARQLLVRIQEKCDIIEEFDKEFSRLEKQEALMREAESADAEINADSSASATHSLVALPTWSQLAQTKQCSPAASERTSMDFTHSQSESGSATPDVATPHMLGIGKRSGTLSRRQSRPSRSSRRSLSRPPKLGSDTAGDTESHTSGSRKLVSLFAALFRNNHGLGRRDNSSGSLLRRRNTPLPFTPNSLPGSSRSSSVLNRVSQSGAAPTTPTTAGSGSRSGSTSVSNANIAALADTPVSAGVAPPSSAAPTPAAASGAADAPPVSPVTRQRNNSQLSTMRNTPESASRVQRMPSIEDFDFVKPISRGAFGRVYLTRKKATQDLFAIKVMRKKDMINKNMVTQALAERRALSLLSTDWVVQLYYAFHSSKHLFLVMEYLVGGDLAGLLRVWGVMDEDSARFYIGEIACAIDYLHRNSIVHRDIKPDNVILASDGHIKLTDFGLSQVAVRGGADGKGLDAGEGAATLDSPSSDTTPLGDTELGGGISDKTEEYWTAALAMSGRNVKAAAAGTAQAAKALPVSKRAHARKSSRGFLGTPDYLAPELLLGAGNGLAVDWWALGVCLFEFICGYPPFMDESPEAIFRNILNHAIDWPDEEGFVSAEAVELINALLRPEPATRAHWKGIQASKMYEGWDFANMRQMEPPFVPQLDDDIDTSYFEACQRKEIQRLSNATFLQVETSLQQTATNTAEEASPPEGSHRSRTGSQKVPRRGSQRGPRCQRSASGSMSASNTGSGAHTSIGQLKKLFTDMATSDNEAPDTPADSNSNSSTGDIPNEVPISSASSSESFLLNDAEVAQSKRSSVALAAVPQNGSDGKQVRDNGSINSLSDSELESPPCSQKAPVATSRKPSVLGGVPLSASPPTQPLINHAKRALGRTPSQCSDGAAELTASGNGPSAKSHSRCASVSTALLTGRKPSVSARSRRPSQGADALSELEAATAGVLVRSSSTDERLQGSNGIASAAVGAADAGRSEHTSETEEEIEDEDEETERVFEDFTYKNLALLNHVNRGMSSSSGSASPMPERPPPGLAASTVGSTPTGAGTSGNRTPAQGPGPSAARDSPVNAYES
ncbi:hypothetical protein GGF43_000736 [Coemansia sp. RSA 2618]|nr:hypothetical protein GGF43_000736 [Coemansia sp. RSA 2618]